MNIHNGERVRPIQTEKYYKSTVLAVMKANLTAHQLDTDKGGQFGYEEARKVTARVIRRKLSTSSRTSPALLMMETRWDLPDREIITDKLRFQARMAERTYRTDREKAAGKGPTYTGKRARPTYGRREYYK
jgi:hypothetical protein